MNSPVDSVSPQYLSKDLFKTKQPVLERVEADLCDRGHYQPRIDFNESSMRDLTDSIIETCGNVVPVILRPKFGGRFEIIAGERRVRACTAAGLSVLALVCDYTDEQAATIAMIENVQREDLNPIEEARGYQQMIDELNLTQKDIANLVGKPRSTIANSLRMLQLDLMARDALIASRIDFGHAKMLAGLGKGDQRIVLRKITSNDWSVRKLEDYLRKRGQVRIPPPPEHNEDYDVARLETELSEITGSPIRIHTSKNGSEAEIRIKCWGLGEFEHIEELLRGRNV